MKHDTERAAVLPKSELKSLETLHRNKSLRRDKATDSRLSAADP